MNCNCKLNKLYNTKLRHGKWVVGKKNNRKVVLKGRNFVYVTFIKFRLVEYEECGQSSLVLSVIAHNQTTSLMNKASSWMLRLVVW